MSNIYKTSYKEFLDKITFVQSIKLRRLRAEVAFYKSKILSAQNHLESLKLVEAQILQKLNPTQDTIYLQTYYTADANQQTNPKQSIAPLIPYDMYGFHPSISLYEKKVMVGTEKIISEQYRIGNEIQHLNRNIMQWTNELSNKTTELISLQVTNSNSEQTVLSLDNISAICYQEIYALNEISIHYKNITRDANGNIAFQTDPKSLRDYNNLRIKFKNLASKNQFVINGQLPLEYDDPGSELTRLSLITFLSIATQVLSQSTQDWKDPIQKYQKQLSALINDPSFNVNIESDFYTIGADEQISSQLASQPAATNFVNTTVGNAGSNELISGTNISNVINNINSNPQDQNKVGVPVRQTTLLTFSNTSLVASIQSFMSNKISQLNSSLINGVTGTTPICSAPTKSVPEQTISLSNSDIVTAEANASALFSSQIASAEAQYTDVMSSVSSQIQQEETSPAPVIATVISNPSTDNLDPSTYRILQNYLNIAEGNVLTAYLDTNGVLAIGRGHQVDGGSLPNVDINGAPITMQGQMISQAQSDAFFAQDIQIAIDGARSVLSTIGLIYDSQQPNVQVVLAELAYEMGEGGLATFSRGIIPLLCDNQFSTAADSFSEQFNKGLINMPAARADSTIQLINMSGIWTQISTP